MGVGLGYVVGLWCLAIVRMSVAYKIHLITDYIKCWEENNG